MTTPELTPLETLVKDVLAAAIAWCKENPPGLGEIFSDELQPLRDAVAALLAGQEARPLTWGTVPSGWEVQAPDGKWYRVTATHLPAGGKQMVTMGSLGTWTRDPGGPVTARPARPDAMDAAIAALGFPEILEDRS